MRTCPSAFPHGLTPSRGQFTAYVCFHMIAMRQITLRGCGQIKGDSSNKLIFVRRCSHSSLPGSHWGCKTSKAKQNGVALRYPSESGHSKNMRVMPDAKKMAGMAIYI